MPQHLQFVKALKVNEKARLRNSAAKSRIKTLVKKVLSAKSKDEAQVAFNEAASAIDSTARKEIINKKAAAREKSKLSKFIAGMK